MAELRYEGKILTNNLWGKLDARHGYGPRYNQGVVARIWAM
jgi:hypothetical protein